MQPGVARDCVWHYWPVRAKRARQRGMGMPRIIYFEFSADSPERATKFYGDVFRWKFQPWAGGAMEYWQVTTGQSPEPGIDGGMHRRSPENQGTRNTIGVESVDATLAAVTKAGGNALMPKTPIPGIGWFAMRSDTEGNVFGLMQDDPKAK